MAAFGKVTRSKDWYNCKHIFERTRMVMLGGVAQVSRNVKRSGGDGGDNDGVGQEETNESKRINKNKTNSARKIRIHHSFCWDGSWIKRIPPWPV
jgi:hypothetical protein